MNNEFLLEHLKLAEQKRKQELILNEENKKSRTEVLKTFAAPIFDFLFLINERYSFNKETSYSHDKKFLSQYATREKLEDQINKGQHYIKIPIRHLEGRDYLQFSVGSNLETEISLSHNTTSNYKYFQTFEEFVVYVSEQVVKVADNV